MTPTSVTALSALTNVLLSAFKLAIGLVSGSAALVADGARLSAHFATMFDAATRDAALPSSKEP